MAKKGSKENPVTSTDLANAAAAILAIKKPFTIKEAHIKDDFCNYAYEITDGIKTGCMHNVKGTLIIDKDMREVFALFNVHLAFIDDVFKHADRKFDYINAMHGDTLATLYSVTGFKIKGSDENEGIILVGTKFVSGGGRINLETPKIPLDENSSYKWKEELRDIANKARIEVELYEGGKGIQMDAPEEKENKKQTKIKFEVAGGETETAPFPENLDEIDSEFENAKM
jgi:hypothetical protein